MFQGSKNHDEEYFAPFEPIGGEVNGTTSRDRTNFYERVPSNYLELALWMESDRMQNFLPVLTQAKLDNQRDVVKNERRQNYENRPYGMAWIRLSETLFPPTHPYHRSVIGSHEDLSAASIEDVRSFFTEYYVPSNAILTLSGSFDPDEARQLITKYFSGIPAGRRAELPRPEAPRLEGIKHVTTTDDVKLPRVYLAWHTPALYAPGDAELDLWASVLSRGKTSRLYRPLVYDQRVAQSVSASQVSMGLAGFFLVEATAAAGVDLKHLSDALLAAFDVALKTPPTVEEFERALNGYKKDFFSRVEEVTERAELLSTYYHLAGRADYLKQDLQRYLVASPESTHRIAQKWLPLDRYARVDVVPGEARRSVGTLPKARGKQSP
jgi:zinc protease